MQARTPMTGLSIEEVTGACKAALDKILSDLPDEINARLKRQRIAVRHGVDTRILIYHVWDRFQPTLLAKEHFSYSFGFDPVLRYFREPLVVRFYASRHRIYDKRDEVISALWKEMQRAEKVLFNFEASMTDRSIQLFRHFRAANRSALEEQIYQGFLELIPYWHPRYAAVIDHYGVSLSRDKIKEVMASRIKFAPTGPRFLGHSSQYSRHIPKRMRAEVITRDGGRCLKCGSTTALHIDHIRPVSLGGLTIVENLQTLCSAENLSKGNREMVDYRRA